MRDNLVPTLSVGTPPGRSASPKHASHTDTLHPYHGDAERPLYIPTPSVGMRKYF